MIDKRLMNEMVEWKLDHPGAELPPHYQNALNESEELFEEWKRTQGWLQALHQPETWEPEDNFFQSLTQNAVREKRRAALSDSTRRELALDKVAGEWFNAVFSWRKVVTVAIVAALLFPTLYVSINTYNNIGAVQYTAGAVMLESSGAPTIQRQTTVKRGQTIQTTTESQTIVELDNGVIAYVDARSRLTLLSPKKVALHVGRVYFDVPKGGKGFEVALPHGEVRVLGTAFSIEISPESSEVMVARGVVEVANQQEKVMVRQGYQSSLAKSGLLPIQRYRDNKQFQWANDLHQDWDKEEMKRYFPSLAAPEKDKR
ncbi:MAG: FecR family protein [Candidatus Hinthialibacter antarcticus]|nr:FecR family protein [Candidatus Hinthialibacter antarcticus]